MALIPARESTSFFEGSPVVRELTPDDFERVATWKLADRGCAAVLFYCAWCPHCVAVKKEWERFGKMCGFAMVAAFNCEKHKSHISKIKEDMPELVKGYPTIIFYSQGSPVEQYMGERVAGEFLKAGMRVCENS